MYKRQMQSMAPEYPIIEAEKVEPEVYRVIYAILETEQPDITVAQAYLQIVLARCIGKLNLVEKSSVGSNDLIYQTVSYISANFKTVSYTHLDVYKRQLQPLLVQKKEDYYEIIAGERRWRAAKLAGLKEVPVIIKDFSEQEVLEISLIENIQRENLNPIEEAAAYKRLMEEFHLKQDEIAERVSKSRTAVTNSMRLLKLDERVQQMIVDEMISTGHARALLALESGDHQYTVAMKI